MLGIVHVHKWRHRRGGVGGQPKDDERWRGGGGGLRGGWRHLWTALMGHIICLKIIKKSEIFSALRADVFLNHILSAKIKYFWFFCTTLFFIRNLVKIGVLLFLKKTAILDYLVSYLFLKIFRNFLFLSDFQIFI